MHARKGCDVSDIRILHPLAGWQGGRLDTVVLGAGMCVDATNMPFDDETFHFAIDKGAPALPR